MDAGAATFSDAEVAIRAVVDRDDEVQRGGRGHDGHVLNEMAHRAAMTARRCHEMNTGNQKEFYCDFRDELQEELTGMEPAELVPGRGRRGRAAA